ncbi:RidA family protein [Mesorhizobium sp.]|uniref:RidA family protein n=1 Tax=Mesorhizobium sp. TaxID=1871066 RepID=UPI0025DDFA70|nr:RidA family protein [Mesorhizobium sp.]
MSFEQRIIERGIFLPEAAIPRAKIRPFVRAGSLVFLSGQIPQWNGEIRFVGKVGQELTVEDGYEAAKLCSLNLVAQLRRALGGSLDSIVQCVRLSGYVNATSAFSEQPKVINGCSDVMTEIFGDAGEHARTAIGVGSLPFNVAVEADAVFEVA